MAFQAAAALGRSALREPRTTHAPQHDDRSSTHAESASGEYRRLVYKCQCLFSATPHGKWRMSKTLLAPEGRIASARGRVKKASRARPDPAHSRLPVPDPR